MGHERLGGLPKSQTWKTIIDKLRILYKSEEHSTDDIARHVLKNVRTRYGKLGTDEIVKTVLSAFIQLSHAYSHPDFDNRIGNLKPDNSDSPTVSSVIQAIKEEIPETEINSEYAQLALRAASDALIDFHKENLPRQASLFHPTDSESSQSWERLGGGAGFCELSKSFFGCLTKRYLDYYLDRITSEHLSFGEKERFDAELKKYVGEVSRHAFETAQITQSFSAGWFNKYAVDNIPNEETKQRFIDKVFAKLQEEFLREESK